MIPKFVGFGLYHRIDSPDFIREQIEEHKPDIITMEVDLNRPNYVTLADFFGWESSKMTASEFEHVAHLAITRGIPYFCVEGSEDSRFSQFNDLTLASTLRFPETSSIPTGDPYWRDRNGNVVGGIEYDLAGEKHLVPFHDIEIDDGETGEGITPRNQFAAAAINKIAKREKPFCLMHFGGGAHFDVAYLKWITKNSRVIRDFVPLQDLVQAERKVLLQSRVDTSQLLYKVRD